MGITKNVPKTFIIVKIGVLLGVKKLVDQLKGENKGYKEFLLTRFLELTKGIK